MSLRAKYTAERPPLVGEVSASFCGRRVPRVSVTDLYGRILGFLDRSRYFLFQEPLNCTQEAEWNPVLDSLFFRKSGSTGNRT
jgi:hypothetical protein